MVKAGTPLPVKGHKDFYGKQTLFMSKGHEVLCPTFKTECIWVFDGRIFTMEETSTKTAIEIDFDKAWKFDFIIRCFFAGIQK